VRRRRSGFTFVELLTAMTIIAILVGIVVPKTGDFIKQAQAAAIVANLNTLRSAVSEYQVDSLSYPPSGALGEVPPRLKNRLPLNFSFRTTDYALQYNHWIIHVSLPGYPNPLDLVGFTVQTDDARLGQLVARGMKGVPFFQSANSYTFIVIGL
jgi:prepilin-type N-terminal cleavage/methylation domain-containing protein